MKSLVKKIFGAALLSLVFLVLPTGGAKALTISPPTFEFGRDNPLSPGDVVLDVIKIFNEGAEPITVYPILQNFMAGNEEAGQPSFYPADQDPNGTALAKWVKFDEKPMTIGPNERANLTFSINVPREGAQPGGHYGAILLSTQPPKGDQGKVSIGQQLGVLVLVRVAGDVKEVGSIAEFGFSDPQVSYNYLPVDFFVRFENAGNTHLNPTGDLFITNWRGKQVASLKVNEDFKAVLPNSIRKFKMSWKNMDNQEEWSGLQREWRNFAIGKYKATLVLNYGTTNQLVTDEVEFSVWPWRLLLILSTSALVVVILFMLLGKAYNKLVISQYERHKKKESDSSPPKQ